MAQFEERRKYTRIYLKAYGFSHECEIDDNGLRHRAKLVDVSQGGTRIQLQNGSSASDFSINDDLVFNCPLHVTAAMDHIKATVCWTSDKELGLRFEHELPITISELQDMLKP